MIRRETRFGRSQIAWITRKMNIIFYEIWNNNRFRIVKFYNIVMIKSTSIFQGNPHVFLECRTQKNKKGFDPNPNIENKDFKASVLNQTHSII